MTSVIAPQRLLIIDIDGLRQDVFHQALSEGRIPHLAGLLGGPEGQTGIHLDPLSPFPSAKRYWKSCPISVSSSASAVRQ